MPQMTCPVCKNHCLLTVEEQAGAITVSGNKCARGDLYGREELNGERKIVTYRAAAHHGNSRRRETHTKRIGGFLSVVAYLSRPYDTNRRCTVKIRKSTVHIKYKRRIFR